MTLIDARDRFDKIRERRRETLKLQFKRSIELIDKPHTDEPPTAA